MVKHGSVALTKNNYTVTLEAQAGMSASFTLRPPLALPDSPQPVKIAPSGNQEYYTPIDSLHLSTEAESVFLSGNSLDQTALTLDFISQSPNLILASPSNSNGKPSFRGLAVADFASLPSLSEWGEAAGNLDLNGNRILNAPAPVSGSELANKAFVEQYATQLIEGFTNRTYARLATTGNVALSGLTAIDTVTPIAGDSILVKNQTNQAENGIYLASSGAWSRSPFFDTAAELKGAYIFVSEGDLNNNTGWYLQTDGAIALGTTPLVFGQFTGLGQIDAGDGLTKNGNQLNVVGTAGRIVVTADAIDLAPTGTAGNYNSVTVDAYGRVTGGTVIAVARVFRLSFTNANLTSGILAATHSLGNRFVDFKVYDNDNKWIEPDEVYPDASDPDNVLKIDLTNYGSIVGTWNLVAIG